MPFKHCSSCTYFDINGEAHAVKLEDIEKSKTDRVGKARLFCKDDHCAILFHK